MGHGPLFPAVRHLCHAVGLKTVRGMTDADLLGRYVGGRDEAAFELLVWRHERMVRAVCRRVLRREHDVEDASQATFLALACKAASVGRRQALGGWLHTVAYRIALRARAEAARRGRHEQKAGEMGGPSMEGEPGQEAGRLELHSVLDEEISRLPAKYRAPVVLCYLEGKTNEEAAAELGCATGTVVTWLARARGRLRSRLARRGLGVTAGALAASLSRPGAAAAAPPAFLRDTVKGALLFAQGGPVAGLVSTRVAALTKGALHAMLFNRMKVVAVALVALCLAGVGPGVLAYRALAEAPRPAAGGPQAPEGNRTGGVAAAAPEADDAVPRPRKEKDERDKEARDRKRADEEARLRKEEAERKKGGRAKAEEVLTRSFKTGKGPQVAVDVFNGDIEVVVGAEGAVEARLTKRSQALTEEEAREGLKKVEVQMTQEKGAVRITARRLQEKRPGQESVTAQLRVPPGSVLDLRTSNGPVKVTGGTGDVKVLTSNGAIRAEGGKGALRLTTRNGEIVVSGATGVTELKTNNGRIDVQGEKAVVKAETSNGAVAFRGSLAGGEHTLSTHNGPVTVTLPAGARFRVDASTNHGPIKNEFGGATVRTGRHLVATVGETPTASLKLHTSNGPIDIRRMK
jgi:RNA polymerase sigma factor (sigma-70 family)